MSQRPNCPVCDQAPRVEETGASLIVPPDPDGANVALAFHEIRCANDACVDMPYVRADTLKLAEEGWQGYCEDYQPEGEGQSTNWFCPSCEDGTLSEAQSRLWIGLQCMKCKWATFQPKEEKRHVTE